MEILTLIIALFFVFIAKLFILKRLSTSLKLPPGPSGFPIIGYLPFLKPRGFIVAECLARQYGPIVGLKLGTRQVIILSSPQVIKEAIQTQGDNFSGRMDSEFNDRFTRKQGLIFIDGPVWKIHRPFTIKILKNFGMGRNISEEIIQNEVECLIAKLDTKIDEQFNPGPVLSESIINVISLLTMGDRLHEKDPKVFDILLEFTDNLTNFGPSSNIINYFPTLEHYLLPLYSRLPMAKKLWDCLGIFNSRVDRRLNLFRSTFDPNSEPTNYCEAFLQEQYRLKSASLDMGTFTDVQLHQAVLELFLAGTDTTANTITWGLLYMALNPHIQEKVREEIHDRLGDSRLPRMEDKKEFNYLLAVLDEIARMASLVPIMVHRNFSSAKIAGYDIPANSICWVHTYGVHRDPTIWKKPDDFYPEHFLTEAGKYRPREELIPFLIGKRSCLGEALAKTELFIFFVALIQCFEFRLVDMTEKDLSEVLLGTNGLIRTPKNFELTIIRHSAKK